MSNKKLHKPDKPESGKIAIATDHGGVSLKQILVDYLQSNQIEVVDYGTKGEESVDYPDFAAQVAAAVSTGKVNAGILVCGTGIGMSITANKFKNVRAALVTDEYTAEMAKRHNNANVVCLGGRVLDPEQAKKLVKIWRESVFEGDRHQRRLDKISEVEKKNFR